MNGAKRTSRGLEITSEMFDGFGHILQKEVCASNKSVHRYCPITDQLGRVTLVDEEMRSGDSQNRRHSGQGYDRLGPSYWRVFL